MNMHISSAFFGDSNSRNVLNFSGIILSQTRRFASSHVICILCNGRNDLKNVPLVERVKALKSGIYIPPGAKVCHSHQEIPSWGAVSSLALYTDFKPSYIEDMLQLKVCSVGAQEKRGKSTVVDIQRITGLTKQKFDDLFARTPSLVVNLRNVENARNALMMYLMRQRKAVSYDTIGERFGVARYKVSSDIKQVRRALTEEFVPRFLGLGNLDRDFLLGNTTVLARTLLCNNNPKV